MTRAPWAKDMPVVTVDKLLREIAADSVTKVVADVKTDKHVAEKRDTK